jgi:hypothetical protein
MSIISLYNTLMENQEVDMLMKIESVSMSLIDFVD